MGRDTHRIVARVSDRRVLFLGAASLARNRLRLRPELLGTPIRPARGMKRRPGLLARPFFCGPYALCALGYILFLEVLVWWSPITGLPGWYPLLYGSPARALIVGLAPIIPPDIKPSPALCWWLYG